MLFAEGLGRNIEVSTEYGLSCNILFMLGGFLQEDKSKDILEAYAKV